MWAALAWLVAAAAPCRADATDDARAMAREGKIVTGIGIGLEGGGIGLIGAAFGTPSCAFVVGAPEEGDCAYGRTHGTEPAVLSLLVAGIIVSIAGDATWIAGATEWSIGTRRTKRLQRATAAR